MFSPMKYWPVLLILLATTGMAQQTASDCTASVPVIPDSLHLIPCGPVIGTFVPEARVEVTDTIGGWARVRVEGWVPVAIAIPRMKAGMVSPVVGVNDSATVIPKRAQCAATTATGKRCSRRAAAGSKYCWQHQPQ